QLAAAVIDVDLHQQRAAGRVDGVGGAHQRSYVGFLRMLGKGEIDLHATLQGLRVELGNVGIDAQRFQSLQMEELGSRALADELAGIDVARRDYAAKRRVDFLKRLQLAKAIEIGLGGFDRGGRGGGLGGQSVGVQLRDGVGLD